MAFVLYRNLGSYLSTENASMRLSSEAVYPNYSVIVNSPVIMASINKEANKVYLSEPVVFTVKHLQVRQKQDYFLEIINMMGQKWRLEIGIILFNFINTILVLYQTTRCFILQRKIFS